jgi:cellulose 1,4-beta-cellobiosidase
MTPAAAGVRQGRPGTTAGVASVDGFISDTANYTPTDEPFLPNSTLQVGGNPLDSANFYQYNPYFDEHSYDDRHVHAALVTAGSPARSASSSTPPATAGAVRPADALNSGPTTAVTAYVAANKIDQRRSAATGATSQRRGHRLPPDRAAVRGSRPVIAYVWIKPPGESDGDYPTGTHTHGDPHCDPNGTQHGRQRRHLSDRRHPRLRHPGRPLVRREFQQLVANAYPAIGSTTGGGGGDTTAPSAPTALAVTGTTSSSVSLSWTASTDNVGVTGYAVYRGSTKVATVTSGTGYTDTGLTAATAYSYHLTAQDAAGNVSAASATVNATTAASGGGGTGSSGCTAAYTVSSDWGAGFNASVTVTDTGTAPTASWKVSWTWAGNQTVSNMWNASYTQSGKAVTVTNAAYNNVIAPGGNTSFGFGGSYSGANAAPVLTCTAG